MDNLTGYPLKDALKIVEESSNRIINIKKVTGTNIKFNNLETPYIIREDIGEKYITLFVSYY
jgi:hypothetical protein